jgi:hypothetical protein
MGNPTLTKLTTPYRRQAWRLLGLLLAVAMLAGVTGKAAAAADDATKMYNEDLFFEKVNALNKIPIGATEAEVIRAVGEPLDKTHLHDGSRVFLYRLRLYKGPGAFGALPQQVYLTSETRLVFDKNGRVSSLYREP